MACGLDRSGKPHGGSSSSSNRISRKKPFMATPLHILGISGSLHKKSHTTAALHAVQQLLPEDVTWKYSPGPNTDVQR
jgi:hypothetical protein